MSVKIFLEGERPTSRNVYDRMHWTEKSDEKTAVRWKVFEALQRCLGPDGDWPEFDRPVEITMTVYYDGRQYDTLNCNPKIYEDALIGWLLVDDNPKYVVGWHIYGRKAGNGKPEGVELVIEEVKT